jgi:hypothetical protein
VSECLFVVCFKLAHASGAFQFVSGCCTMCSVSSVFMKPLFVSLGSEWCYVLICFKLLIMAAIDSLGSMWLLCIAVFLSCLIMIHVLDSSGCEWLLHLVVFQVLMSSPLECECCCTVLALRF